MEIVGVRPLLPSEGSDAPCTRFSVPCGMKRVHGHKDFAPAGSLVGRWTAPQQSPVVLNPGPQDERTRADNSSTTPEGLASMPGPCTT
jgi:hypothetical protein